MLEATAGLRLSSMPDTLGPPRLITIVRRRVYRMPTRSDQSYVLAARQAKSPELSGFFRQLASRAEDEARMQDALIEGIIRHREATTGKPFSYTKRQERFLDCFDKDAAQAERDMENLTERMDDRNLLICALSSECLQLKHEEARLASYRPEDRELAQSIVNFRRETIRMIEQFVENSPFKGQVVPIGQGKKKKTV